MFAADLESYLLDDVEVALTRIGLRPREEFETAFPDLGTMLEAIKLAGRDRRIADAKYGSRRRALPVEETVPFHEEVQELINKTQMP